MPLLQWTSSSLNVLLIGMSGGLAAPFLVEGFAGLGAGPGWGIVMACHRGGSGSNPPWKGVGSSWVQNFFI